MSSWRIDGYRPGFRVPIVVGVQIRPNISKSAEHPDDATAADSRPSRLAAARAYGPGVLLAVVIAAVATVIGKLLPIVGGPVSGIVIGVVVAAIIKPGEPLHPGIKFSSKTILQISVVVLGSQLSLTQIVKVGFSSLPVMLGSLIMCLLAAYWIGRWLGLVGDLRTLIGVGTGICGASAIAAVTPVIGAVSADVAYAVSTIFLFNIAAVLVFPVIGHLLGMSQHAFGLFAGTAVNDTSSVVAAAATYGPQATNYAVVVKLTRTLLIIPICLGLAAIKARRDRTQQAAEDPSTVEAATDKPARSRLWVIKLVPWFLVGFLIVAAANSIGIIPTSVHPALNEISVFLITVALSAIGLSTDLRALRRAGARPLVLGACLWVIVALTSIGLQYLTGTL
ncbi:putative integral membrane protein (TIGR00698 family) [Antricoccus suffuscus]|uniref:Putative integral membrane protein (TIGR00698 family) n=1 Tax=Antricoccus suffuscus TaxID=1629062 RepID=A0A2T1A3D5_9ACTN|nr:YeiH family protein [Antricoccus suffuscus]PRZ43119.1 putative integral membrane protein (TIGR00698 family) [Antricoccus suffuscus]